MSLFIQTDFELLEFCEDSTDATPHCKWVLTGNETKGYASRRLHCDRVHASKTTRHAKNPELRNAENNTKNDTRLSSGNQLVGIRACKLESTRLLQHDPAKRVVEHDTLQTNASDLQDSCISRQFTA